MQRFLVFVLLLATVVGCTSYRAAREAEMAVQAGDWDAAVLHYMQALEEDPGNIAYRSALLRAQVRASQAHFEKGKEFHEAGVLERALVEFQQAVQLDPSNQFAQVELQKVREEIAAAREERAPRGTVEELKERTRFTRPQPPVLNPRSDEPISLEFPEPTPVKSIYQALGKAFGINVLYDPNLKDVPVPIVLRDVTAQEALEILMRAAGHFYKVVDEQTILIAADTPQNRRTYEDLVIQAFFLSNADVKDAMTTLRSLIGAKQLAMNEQLNAIILRDTADKVKVAERIIETIDKAKAEVVVDVELLQINSSKVRDLGLALSDYQITQSLDFGQEESGGVRLSDLEFINQNNWTLSIPSFLYNFVKTNTDAQLLAQPRLRISEGETARLVIGDRVPIPVTSFNTANTVGGNIVPITSFQYQEVGITIQIEPRVHHNREVTLTLTVEVSQVSGQVSSGGQQQPIIGTRNIESTIRLKDGETNFLAGLIRTDDSDNDAGIPGLSDIPVLGRLFSNNRSESRRTDVILTLTPHIVRLPDITEEDLLPIWVGTEQNITFRGGSPRVESLEEGPFDGPDQASPEEIRRRIRDRLQRLPPGLRNADGAEEGATETPPGQELVPGQSSPFGGQEPMPSEPPPPQIPRPFDPEEPPLASLEDPTLDDGLALDGGLDLDGVEPIEPRSLDEELDALTGLIEAEAAARQLALEEAGAFASFAAATSSPLAREAAVTVSLVPEQDAVAPGATVAVDLAVQALEPVAHLPVTLVYDPQRLAVETVEAGDFLGDGAQVLSDASTPGRLVLGASRLGRAPGVAGAGRLARIVFRAVGEAEGPTEVRFERVQAQDADLSNLGVRSDTLELTVGSLIEGGPERPERPGDGGLGDGEPGES